MKQIHPDPKEYRRAYMSKRWHGDEEYRKRKYAADRANLLRKREREARELDKLRGGVKSLETFTNNNRKP